MSFVSALSNLKDSALKVTGSKKVSQIRVYPSSAVADWTTSSRLIQYFLPPQRVALFDRSGVTDVVNVPALGANARFHLNPAVMNRWQSVRLQIGGTEVINLSNLNNGYSRCVRDACEPVEQFYSNCRLARGDNLIGFAGSACPSEAHGGLAQLLVSIAAIPTVAQILGENQYVPYYYQAANDVSDCQSSNTPSEAYLGTSVNAATTFQHYTDFSEFYGTALACPVGLPTGNGSVLEFVQDSVDKSILEIVAADAATNAATILSALEAAAVSTGGVTISGHFLKLTVLANDGIENAEDEYYRMNEGAEVNIPYCDQINQGVAAGTTFSTNVTLPVAGRTVRAVCAALVLPSTNCRDTQSNGSNGSTTNMTSARATLNGVPDTNDILYLNNSTLASWNISNSLKGSPLGDCVAYSSHPVYVTNLTGMTLPELHRPQNVLTEVGKYFDSPLVYQLEGTQDAIARSCQFYLLSSKKAKISRNGIVM